MGHLSALGRAALVVVGTALLAVGHGRHVCNLRPCVVAVPRSARTCERLAVAPPVPVREAPYYLQHSPPNRHERRERGDSDESFV